MSDQKKSLKRSIGVLQLVMFYFSTIVGVGIFVVPLEAAKKAGPASIISWIAVLLMAYPFAMIYARISQRYKVSGSIQKFVEEVFGAKYGQVLALFLVLTALFGDSLLGFSAARYLIELLGLENKDSVYWICPLMLLIPIFMNLQAVARSAKIQSITLISLVLVVLFIVLTAVPSYDTANLVPFAPYGYSSVLGAIVICFYSIVGWENVDAMAEEVIEPGKTYGKAIKIALAAISIFYLTLVSTVLLVLNQDSLSSSNTILTTLISKLHGAQFSPIGGIVAITLLLLGANAWIFGTSRFIYALARDGVLPNFLTKMNKNSVPYNSVLIQMFFYVFIASVMGYMAFEEMAIVEMASLNYLMLYSFVFAAGVKGFTTVRLKLLSFVALIVAAFFLTHSINSRIVLSFISLAACVIYITTIKRNKTNR